MKHKLNILKIAKIFWLPLVIMSFYNSHACNSLLLSKNEAKQTFTTNLDSSGHYFTILKFDTSYFQYVNMTFGFSGGQMEISFYSEDPCLNKEATVIESFTISNNPTTLQWKPTYAFCKVLAVSEKSIQFSIALKVKQDIEDCSAQENRFNSFENPVKAGVLQVGQNCLEVCNQGVRFNNPEHKISNHRPSRKTKWVKYDIELQTIVKITNQTIQANPRCILYGYEGGNYFYIKDIDLTKQDSQYYQFTPYSSILLGFYFSDNKEGDFSVCLQKYPITNSCIDFFGEESGQKIEAIHTSKGSPIAGPYLMGEEVTFSYKLIEWMPINQNWIHGFYVQYGTGWKGFKQNEDSTKFVVNWNDTIVSIDSIPVKLNTEFVTKDTIRFSGFAVKTLKLPGFYVSNESTGPLGPSQNYRWGHNVRKVHGSDEDPLQEIFFTLVADSTGDCSIPLSASVFVQPLSDYETGIYEILGCVENTTLEHQAQIICCQSLANVVIQDSILCDGDIYFFPSSTEYSGTWQITNTPQGNAYNLNQQSFSAPLRAINNSGVVDTILVEIILTDSTGCQSFQMVEFLVKAKMESLKINMNDICKDQKVNLNQLFSKEAGFDVRLSSDNDFSDTYRDKEGNVWLSGNTVLEKEYNLESSGHCVINSLINYNPISCQDHRNDESSIDISIYPNPTMDKAKLTVLNNTESASWTILLLNSSNQIIWHRSESIPQGSAFSIMIDMTGHPEGLYYVSVNDGDIILTRRLINVNP